MDIGSSPYPEFLYACRRFSSFFASVLNGIDQSHQEFFNQKRAELLAEVLQFSLHEQKLEPFSQIDQFRASPEWAKIQSDRNFATALPEDKTREARMERLKRDFKEYSELLYSTASARLRSEALAARTEALTHYRMRNGNDEDACLKLSEALDDILNTSEVTKPSAQLFNCPLYHEGLSRLNPIDLTK